MRVLETSHSNDHSTGATSMGKRKANGDGKQPTKDKMDVDEDDSGSDDVCQASSCFNISIAIPSG